MGVVGGGGGGEIHGVGGGEDVVFGADFGGEGLQFGVRAGD